jgi:malate dehydrogenase (oxaloacetate-decarboxylating)
MKKVSFGMSHTSVVLRVELDHEVATFGDVAAVISKAGGDILPLT